jgi:hypothetical protein
MPVTAFTFSTEQLRAAPPEVQRWVASEIARALGAVNPQGAWPGAAPAAPRQPQAMTLAACSAAEAAQVFEMVATNTVVARLFFELARESSFGTSLPGLHAMRIADLMHHAGLAGQDGLYAALGAIDRAFREVRGAGAGSLFGFDEAGHLFVHEATQSSIRRVWEELLEAHAAVEREQPAPAPQFEGFRPPRVGPSEDIAAHLPLRAVNPGNAPF